MANSNPKTSAASLSALATAARHGFKQADCTAPIDVLVVFGALPALVGNRDVGGALSSRQARQSEAQALTADGSDGPTTLSGS
jgi:hypothetical protein